MEVLMFGNRPFLSTFFERWCVPGAMKKGLTLTCVSCLVGIVIEGGDR